MSNPTGSNLATFPIRSSKFFFEDSMVVIQIENVQYKVHKSKLIESETFADMFALAESPNSSDMPVEGSSSDYPIKLEGVVASDFECLLTLLYERHYTPQHPELDASLVLPAFRLAHMWNFKQLREYLLPHLKSHVSDVDKIVYSREFDIEDWSIPAYIQLCRRTEPLNSEEAEKIGFKGAMLIFRVREENYLRPKVNSQRCCGHEMQDSV